jgi:hypothetical protein
MREKQQTAVKTLSRLAAGAHGGQAPVTDCIDIDKILLAQPLKY